MVVCNLHQISIPNNQTKKKELDNKISALIVITNIVAASNVLKSQFAKLA